MNIPTKLASIAKAFGEQTAAEISAKKDELAQERRELVRAHAGKTKDDAHDALDRARSEARERLEMMTSSVVDEYGNVLLDPSLGSFSHLERLQAYQLANSEPYWESLHEAVDAAGDEHYAPLTRPQYEARVAKLDEEIRKRAVELERRELEARQAAVEAEQAALMSALESKIV
jgi:hypothetical protein